MENAIQIYQPTPAVVKTDHENYKLTIGENDAKKVVTLKRNVDFGKVGKATKPSLYKAGAEKVLMAYGVESKFVLEQAVEDFGNGERAPMFFYRFRCELWKGDQHITDGYGSANSNESACGRMAKWDAANQRLKIAKKRAMVDACLMLAQISGAFAQDIEDSSLDEMEFEKVTSNVMRPESPISGKQVKRLYALCTKNGVDADQAKEIIKKAGYDSAKEIKQKDYDAICNKIEGFSETIEGEIIE